MYRVRIISKAGRGREGQEDGEEAVRRSRRRVHIDDSHVLGLGASFLRRE